MLTCLKLHIDALFQTKMAFLSWFLALGTKTENLETMWLKRRTKVIQNHWNPCLDLNSTLRIVIKITNNCLITYKLLIYSYNFVFVVSPWIWTRLRQLGVRRHRGQRSTRRWSRIQGSHDAERTVSGIQMDVRYILQCYSYHVIVVIDGHVAVLTCLVFYEVYKQKSTVGFQFLTWLCSLSVLYNRDIARSSPSSLDGKHRAMFKLCQLI